MAGLVWTGAGLALTGLITVCYCIYAAMRARREAAQDDAALRARLQRIVAINMGGLLVSILGLMCVVLGILLG